jgi:hypothetical protein
MSSFTSSTGSSSFGGRGPSSDGGSDFGMSPTKEMGSHMNHLEKVAEDQGDEPLDHPVYSTFSRETTVTDKMSVG